MKDYLGTVVKVGDRVAYSDSGRGGPVHTGEVISIASTNPPKDISFLRILDDRTNRINRRLSIHTLVLQMEGF